MDKIQKRTHRLADVTQDGEVFDFFYREVIPRGDERSTVTVTLGERPRRP